MKRSIAVFAAMMLVGTSAYAYQVTGPVLEVTDTKIVVEKGGNNLLYLPLDKIMQAGGAVAPSVPSVPGTGAAASAPVAPPADASGRTRDAFRAREREQRP